jgi:hypothetical protein
MKIQLVFLERRGAGPGIMRGRALFAFSSSDQIPNKMGFMRRFVNQN